jgi:predicted RNase H-like HicB family nuclease
MRTDQRCDCGRGSSVKILPRRVSCTILGADRPKIVVGQLTWLINAHGAHLGSRGTGAVRNWVEYPKLMELIFEIRDAEEGGFYARALGHAIFTEGDTWEELRANVLEAVSLHFEDLRARPRLVQMHYVRDELIPVEAA